MNIKMSIPGTCVLCAILCFLLQGINVVTDASALPCGSKPQIQIIQIPNHNNINVNVDHTKPGSTVTTSVFRRIPINRRGSTGNSAQRLMHNKNPLRTFIMTFIITWLLYVNINFIS